MIKPLSITSLLFLLVSSLPTHAQKSDSTHTHYAFYRGFSTHETELKSKKGIKNGEYKIFNGHSITAKGLYKNDERIGLWEFYKNKDSIEQVYNYTTKKVVYSQPFANAKFYLDSLKEGDRIVYPTKIGGSFGIYFLLRLFRPPNHPLKSAIPCPLLYIFSIDESGKLIRYQTKIEDGSSVILDEIPLEKLRAEDFEFSPAKLNGRQVASTLVIEALFDPSKRRY
ncbi:MAG: hypothetical protein REI78_11610 [Pedobacter sp.]|nr:hypothetical protein [Pedobacter sp.]